MPSGGYVPRLQQLLSLIDKKVVEEIVGEFLGAERIWIMGNGGSMATAMHFAEDLVISGRTAQAISDVSFLTMAANDFGYDRVFEKWLEKHEGDGDVVVGISTSGRSENVIRGLQFTNARKIGLIGRTGSPMKAVCDVVLEVGTGEGLEETKLAEDVHSVLCHLISEKVREARRPAQQVGAKEE